MKNYWNLENISEYFKKEFDNFGYIPKRDFYNGKSSETKPSIKDIKRIFKKHDNVSHVLGLISEEQYNKKNKSKILINESFDEINRFVEEFGRLPFVKEYNKYRTKGLASVNLSNQLNETWNNIMIQYFNKEKYISDILKLDDIKNVIKSLSKNNENVLMKDVALKLNCSQSTIIKILNETPFCKILEECNVKPIKNSNKPKTDDYLKNEFIRIRYELGRTSYVEDINAMSNISFGTMSNRFGGIEGICKECGIEFDRQISGYGTISIDLNGDVCRSRAEKCITDFFIMNNIIYEKEVPYSNFIINHKNRRFDWVIYTNDGNKYPVEYFGLINNKKYLDRHDLKIKDLKDENINCICIYPNIDLNKNLNIIFKEFIQKERLK